VLRSVQPQGPYLLGGYCFGGLVAFEMAQRLREEGQITDLLALIEPSFGKNPAWNSSLPQAASRLPLSNPGLDPQPPTSLGPHEQRGESFLKCAKPLLVGALHNAIHAAKRTFQRITWAICTGFGLSIPVSMRSPYILDIYRKAMRSYTPRLYGGNVILFAGDGYSQTLRQKWFELCCAKLTIHQVPGDHSSVLVEPNLGQWAKKLKTCLDEAQQR